MKLNDLFEEVDSRQPTSFITVNGGGVLQASGSWGMTQNAVFNTGNTRVRITNTYKIFGMYIWKKYFEVSVSDFFEKMKMSKQEIKVINGAIEKYLLAIEKAEKFGQRALVEKMKDDIEVIKKETIALASGVKEYLTDEQVDKLLSKTTKNIEITYIKNFTRPIPDKLLSIKEKLDNNNVFDDYVVFHYDPKKKNTELTKKEKIAKKDPILFGVIKGSRNLYYVGDWVDELCNLTLKEALTVIEGQTKKI